MEGGGTVWGYEEGAGVPAGVGDAVADGVAC